MNGVWCVCESGVGCGRGGGEKASAAAGTERKRAHLMVAHIGAARPRRRPPRGGRGCGRRPLPPRRTRVEGESGRNGGGWVSGKAAAAAGVWSKRTRPPRCRAGPARCIHPHTHPTHQLTKLGDLARRHPAAQQVVQVWAKGDDAGGGGLGRQQGARGPAARQGGQGRRAGAEAGGPTGQAGPGGGRLGGGEGRGCWRERGGLRGVHEVEEQERAPLPFLSLSPPHPPPQSIPRSSSPSAATSRSATVR